MILKAFFVWLSANELDQESSTDMCSINLYIPVLKTWASTTLSLDYCFQHFQENPRQQFLSYELAVASSSTCLSLYFLQGQCTVILNRHLVMCGICQCDASFILIQVLRSSLSPSPSLSLYRWEVWCPFSASQAI